MDPYGNLVRQLMTAAMSGQVSTDGYEFPEPLYDEGPVSVDDAGLGMLEYFRKVKPAAPGELPEPLSPYGEYDRRMEFIPSQGQVPPGMRAKRHDAYFAE